MFVTMCREAYDDFVRFRRDREVNSQKYNKLTKKGLVTMISLLLWGADVGFILG